MPRRSIHPDLKHAAVHLSAIFSPQVVASLLDVSEDAVQRVIEQSENTGEVVTLSTEPWRQKPKLTEEEKLYVQGLIEMQSDLYLDEIQDIITKTTGKSLPIRAVRGILNSMGITSKGQTRPASKPNPRARAAYAVEIAQYESEQLIFLDECYFDKRTTARLQGLPRRGTRATARSPSLCGTRYSILLALSRGGVLDTTVIPGAVDGDLFFEFLQDLVCQMNPYPEKNSVLVMDHAKFHHDPRVAELLKERGIRLVYLPPYTPQYNPINEFFSCVQNWIRRNSSLVESRTVDEATIIIVYAVYTCAEPDRCVEWFRNGGYF